MMWDVQATCPRSGAAEFLTLSMISGGVWCFALSPVRVRS